MEFDCVVFVEMFEYMCNYEKLFCKVSEKLKFEGKLFVYIFIYKEFIYKFEVIDESDWMSKYFFIGGIMLFDDFFFYFNSDMWVVNYWYVLGIYY